MSSLDRLGDVIEVEFARFRGLVDRLLPDQPPFLPGVGEDELRILAAELGFALPEELSAMLRIAGGQDRRNSPDGPIDGHRFLTVDEILREYTALRSAVGDLAAPAAQPGFYTDHVWSPAWVPFAELTDQYYMVDLAPGQLGTRGQVFLRYSEPQGNPPDAPSLGDFLRMINDGVEDGTILVDDGTFAVAR